jgi:hypothetical protein
MFTECHIENSSIEMFVLLKSDVFTLQLSFIRVNVDSMSSLCSSSSYIVSEF